jgi:hypothetical protein
MTGLPPDRISSETVEGGGGWQRRNLLADLEETQRREFIKPMKHGIATITYYSEFLEQRIKTDPVTGRGGL